MYLTLLSFKYHDLLYQLSRTCDKSYKALLTTRESYWLEITLEFYYLKTFTRVTTVTEVPKDTLPRYHSEGGVHREGR